VTIRLPFCLKITSFQDKKQPKWRPDCGTRIWRASSWLAGMDFAVKINARTTMMTDKTQVLERKSTLERRRRENEQRRREERNGKFPRLIGTSV